MTQNQEIFLKEFIEANAILKGHFILSSGLHSDTYMQCARVLMDTKRSERLCRALANKIIQSLGDNFADIVIAPAMGGILVGYEIGRQLGITTIFCERVNGEFQIRRGFELEKNSRVLVVEDVITTGKSSLETFSVIKKHGGIIVAEASLVDRSSRDDDLKKILGVPVVSLIKIDVKTFDENSTPEELKNTPAIKPGSRFINK